MCVGLRGGEYQSDTITLEEDQHAREEVSSQNFDGRQEVSSRKFMHIKAKTTKKILCNY